MGSDLGQNQLCDVRHRSGEPISPQSRPPSHRSAQVGTRSSARANDAIVIQSSYSGGLHLYFPLEKPIASWKIAEAIALVVEAAGFKVKDGQLEIFPNNRNQHQLLYKAHRLPLQMGSYLLNQEFETISQSESLFVSQWEFASDRSACTEKECDRALKRLKRNKYALSTKAESFLNDLNADIELRDRTRPK